MYTILVVLFSLLCLTLTGQNNVYKEAHPFERKVFIENKGQFKNYKEYTDINLNDLQFAIDRDYKVFFYPNKLVYKIVDVKYYSKEDAKGKGKTKEERRTEKIEKVEVEWLNSNSDVSIIPSKKIGSKYTYAGKNLQNEDFYYSCSGYEKIVYKNLYDNIDVEYLFHSENGVKYNLILHPGANIEDVKMKYTGVDVFIDESGRLILPTELGNIIENAPFSFYKEGDKEEVESSFKVQNSIVSFVLDSYDTTKELVLDPWVIVPASPLQTFDNGVDGLGNVYIYGRSMIVEKYDPLGNLIWSLTPGIDRSYYGDLLVESTGNFYLCEGFIAGGARTYKFNTTSAMVWQSTFNGSFREHWRLALNCITQKVIVAGGGTTSPTLNIAEVDVNTGVLVNAKSVYSGSQSDVAGLTVDQQGRSYLKHSNPNIVTFTDNLNNALANVSDGYGYSEIGLASASYMATGIGNGVNMMALGGGFLYTTNGGLIKKWDIVTRTVVASITIPGASRMAGGILTDDCNNLFIGGANGVYRFDFNLVQQEFHATASPVYDIAFSSISPDIIASGNGYLSSIPFGRFSCATVNKIVTIDSCNTSINTIEIQPTIGIAPFTFLWADGNTNSTRTNLIPGTYPIMIKDAACVPSFVFDTVVIPAKLFFIDFERDTVCFGMASSFLGTAISLTGLTNIWSWDFGDGNTSTLQNPSNLYGTSGVFSAFLTVTNGGGCFDTITKSVLVNAMPNPNFAVNNECVNFNSIFVNNTTISSPDSVVQWMWNFGDITSMDSTSSPIHLYALYGTYPVTLTATSDKGCIDSLTLNTIIYPKPTALFNVTSGCESFIQFTDSSMVVQGSIVDWNWDFNDGSLTGTTQNPVHYYGYDTLFNPVLIVTTNNGCKDTITHSTIMNAIPNVNFSYTPECRYDSIHFNNLTTIANTSTITNYVWGFGDGSGFISATNPTHIYAASGGYAVTLIATSNNGCVNDTTLPIVVYPVPIAGYTSTTVCENFGITEFTDTSSVVTGNIVLWQWSFADNNNTTSSLINPTNDYTYSGTFNVQLIVTSDNNCIDTVVNPVIVYPKPTINFTQDIVEGCSPVCVNFSDNSLANSVNIVEWIWDLGNGDISSEKNPSTCYINKDNLNDAYYSVELIIQNDRACYDTLWVSDLITSWHNPISSFTVSPEEINMYEAEIMTTNSSQGADFYSWDFANSTISSDFEPIVVYEDTGTYNIMLAVSTIHICVDTSYQSVKVTPVISIYIPNAFTPNRDGVNEGFIFKGFGIDLSTTKFYIFDRWGELIYYTEQNIPWDGTHKNINAKEDAYVYKLECKDVYGVYHQYIGHVVLLR